jgi:hypothetical protein
VGVRPFCAFEGRAAWGSIIMIVPCSKERVVVGKQGSPYLGDAIYVVHMEYPDPRSGEPVRGEYLATAVMDDRGFVTFALPHQMRPAEEADEEALKEEPGLRISPSGGMLFGGEGADSGRS